jgi:hypothetical protein
LTYNGASAGTVNDQSRAGIACVVVLPVLYSLIEPIRHGFADRDGGAEERLGSLVVVSVFDR